ncbi:transposable element gene [Prunus dulcis]|uniref:Transposable element protein n=1 Tax=Prunus dulcis TaxID=3755 RepID=A0A4Y1RMA1_PRUDU|nr:transposable element gene [Prunus dulcis]
MGVPEDSRLLGLKSHDCHTLMQQLLPVAIRSVLEKPARWMYPFERYMKVLKGYVQNRTRPEGCIAERTVGVPSSQKMGVSKPLSGCTVSVVDQDLLNQAHLYVLENTEEVLPYIEYATYDPHQMLIQNLEREQSGLQDKHNSTFIQWLRFRFKVNLRKTIMAYQKI